MTTIPGMELAASQMLRFASALASDYGVFLEVGSDSELLMLWRHGLPHADLVHNAVPPDGARIVALSRREADANGARQRACILWSALHHAPGTSRKRAAYMLLGVLIYLCTTPADGSVAQFVGFDVLGCTPLVLEQQPCSRRRFGSLPVVT